MVGRVWSQDRRRARRSTTFCFSSGTLRSRCVGYLQESKGTAVCIATAVEYPSPSPAVIRVSRARTVCQSAWSFYDVLKVNNVLHVSQPRARAWSEETPPAIEGVQKMFPLDMGQSLENGMNGSAPFPTHHNCTSLQQGTQPANNSYKVVGVISDGSARKSSHARAVHTWEPTCC